MTPGRELAGKVVLVTGGARNIGRAIAQSLAAGGASVMVNARQAREDVDETVRSIEAASGTAASCMADVTDPQAVAAMVSATVTRFGRLDALINNAAARTEQAFTDMSFDDWRRIVSVILDGAFLCSQACLPHLIRAGGGTIVNIGGETGHKGAADRAHVVTAKAGLAGLTKALALDLAPQRITVNCVVPGCIETVREAPAPGPHRSAPPLGRFGRPEEVAAMVRMLCGPHARYITGQSIHVNGGGYMP
ncbi:MAG: 3-oxoacyl-ACP reductase FabG [Betaproteobacteria bacterium]|nr:3-oxoacyl-ACP reductase FabG [Betaproteobacteria bacterium]